MSETKVLELEKDIVIDCPHCNAPILIQKLNCRIFRHGTYKQNNEQINPHTSQEECNELLMNNMIYGCGKPFKIEAKEGEYLAVICEYI